MSFADPHFDASVRTSKALISQPRGADFEIDPHVYLEGVDEDNEEIPVINENLDDLLAPPPLAYLSSPETSSDGPLSPRKIIRAATRSAASKVPRQSSRKRIQLSPRDSGLMSSRSSSPQHLSLSRPSPKREQSTRDIVSSSHRRLSEPSRRSNLLVSSELPGVYTSHGNSPSSRRASGLGARVVSDDEVDRPSPRKNAHNNHHHHHRRSSTRATSRRNLMVPLAPDLTIDSPHGGASNRKVLDRSVSDNVEFLKSAAGTSNRVLVAPSKLDTPTYNGSRKGVTRSSSESSSRPTPSRRDLAQAALAAQKHQILSPSSKSMRRISHGRSKSPSQSRRKKGSKCQSHEERNESHEAKSSAPHGRSRSDDTPTHTSSRSKSRERRSEDSSRRGRRTTGTGTSKEQRRSRSKSRDASSRRHGLRSTAGARVNKSTGIEKDDALTLLYSVLGSNQTNQKLEQSGDTSDKPPVQLLQNDIQTQKSEEGAAPQLSPLNDRGSSSSLRRPSPGVTFSPESRYVLSNQAFKDKKEESKVRRSNIMKSLKDLLQFDAENLKVEVQKDGTKRLVVELSDLNTVMEEFENYRH